jgi:GNAT superfamily N-acetyltransferase
MIRRAAEGDIRRISTCLQSAFEPFRSLYTPGAYSDTVLTPEACRRRISAMWVYVAAARGEIIGTIACFANDSGAGHLRGMAVHPDWHGRGIAQALLTAVETKLAENGCLKVTLDTTEPLQRAIHFYEKNGYHCSGKVADFFGMPLHEYVKTFLPASES